MEKMNLFDNVDNLEAMKDKLCYKMRECVDNMIKESVVDKHDFEEFSKAILSKNNDILVSELKQYISSTLGKDEWQRQFEDRIAKETDGIECIHQQAKTVIGSPDDLERFVNNTAVQHEVMESSLRHMQRSEPCYEALKALIERYKSTDDMTEEERDEIISKYNLKKLTGDMNPKTEGYAFRRNYMKLLEAGEPKVEVSALSLQDLITNEYGDREIIWNKVKGACEDICDSEYVMNTPSEIDDDGIVPKNMRGKLREQFREEFLERYENEKYLTEDGNIFKQSAKESYMRQLGAILGEDVKFLRFQGDVIKYNNPECKPVPESIRELFGIDDNGRDNFVLLHKFHKNVRGKYRNVATRIRVIYK